MKVTFPEKYLALSENIREQQIKRRKAQAVSTGSINKTLIDGQKRIIGQGVSMLTMNHEISIGGKEKRRVVLHCKREDIPANLIGFVRGYLREMGWQYLHGRHSARGIWEGDFEKAD